jgi:hypothetical protein
MNEFAVQMAKRSNGQLLDIVIVRPFKYQENAVEAANEELVKRKIPDIDEMKKHLIQTHFTDLTNYTDSQLSDYSLGLKIRLKKSDKEVHHILKMGNLPEERYNYLIVGFNNSVEKLKKDKSDFNKLIGALMIIGGVGFTILSFSSAQNAGGGTYFIAIGAIIYGIIRFFNFI